MIKEFIIDVDQAKDESYEINAPVTTSEFMKNKYTHEIKEFDEAEYEEGFFYLIYKYHSDVFKEIRDKEPGNSDTHIVRFMMLATCISYGGNLYHNRNRVKKSTLSRIWDLNAESSINKTYNLLKDIGYIYMTDEGYIMINEDIVVKGSVSAKLKELKKNDENFTYMRIYIQNIKRLYYDTPTTQKKKLANLFLILPYINYKYNVFCSNPTETDVEKLDLLNWTDLARICDYNVSQAARFKRELFKLKLYGCDVIGCFERSTGKTIIVNPAIYYVGNNVDDVLYLYKLFDMKPKKHRKK